MPSVAPNQTMMTVVSSGEMRWCIRAICFDTDFDPNAIQPLFSDAVVLFSSPFVIELKGSIAVFLPFGVLLYWAGAEQTFVEIMRRIEMKFNARSLMVSGQNELNVSSNHSEDAVHFRDIELKQLSVEHIKVISETFGQSLALHRCQAAVQDLLASCRPPVQELVNRGDIHMSSKAILKLVGNTLALREETLSKLALIDTPPEAWQSERLTRLHGQLYDHFKIKPRLLSLQTKLDYLLDVNETLMNLIRHHESHRLEWIIIFLIIIEVIYSTLHFFGPAK